VDDRELWEIRVHSDGIGKRSLFEVFRMIRVLNARRQCARAPPYALRSMIIDCCISSSSSHDTHCEVASAIHDARARSQLRTGQCDRSVDEIRRDSAIGVDCYRIRIGTTWTRAHSVLRIVGRRDLCAGRSRTTYNVNNTTKSVRFQMNAVSSRPETQTICRDRKSLDRTNRSRGFLSVDIKFRPPDYAIAAVLQTSRELR